MKTTLDIEDKILAQAKALAAQEQTTLTKLVEQGLALRMRAQLARAGKPRINLPVSNTRGGLFPHIDYCSNKSMFEAADEDS